MPVRSGWFTAVSTYLVLTLYAFFSGGFSTVLPEIWSFLSGNLGALSHEHEIARLLPQIAAWIVISLPLAITSGLIGLMYLGEAPTLFQMMIGEEPEASFRFGTFLWMVLLEELFARELALRWISPDEVVLFYAAGIAANVLWALAHLQNYRFRWDRHPLRVAPQFVAGFFFALAWVKGGILCAAATHIGYNAILFASDKRQDFSRWDLRAATYSLVVAALASIYLRGRLVEIAPWLHGQVAAPLPGWTLGDYIALAVLISGTLTAAMELLQYDRVSREVSDETRPFHPVFITVYFFFAAVMVLLQGTIVWLAHSVGLRGEMCVLILTLAISAAAAGPSGSFVARRFWHGVPLNFLVFTMYEVVGHTGGMMVSLITALVFMPAELMNLQDAIEERRAREDALFRSAVIRLGRTPM